MLVFREKEGEDGTVEFFRGEEKCGYLTNHVSIGWVVEQLYEFTELGQSDIQQIADKLAELDALEAAEMVII
mgnify:CR=1 FL=1